MHAPITQEEIDYRNAMTNKINAISNAQSLFADIEDKGRKLIILKGLISSLNYGNDIIDQIDLEIAAYNQSKKEEAAAAAMEALAAEGAAAAEAKAATKVPAKEAPVEELPTEEAPAEEAGLDLTPMPNEALPEGAPAEESFKPAGNTTILKEEQDLLDEANDLPTPEDAAKDRDFTENN